MAELQVREYIFSISHIGWVAYRQGGSKKGPVEIIISGKRKRCIDVSGMKDNNLNLQLILKWIKFYVDSANINALYLFIECSN